MWNTACRTHRGVSPHHRERLEPQGVSASNPKECARSAYMRQCSIVCLHVRKGTSRESGTSEPTLAARCPRFSSSRDPTASSVRKTKMPLSARFRMEWLRSIQLSIPSAAGSPLRGGRSSTVMSGPGRRRRSTSSAVTPVLPQDARSRQGTPVTRPSAPRVLRTSRPHRLRS